MQWLYKKRRCSQCGTEFNKMNYKDRFCSSRCSIEFNNKKSQLKKDYHITQRQYAEMVLKQEGLCAVCNKIPEGTMQIDHDHKTGLIRALLCLNCNILLGHAKEDIKILESAISYLNRFKSQKIVPA